ncbi:laccase 5 [Coprinopsis marcescibilis]|uniref:Laccase 5 n=1 Tax=Coprinopsis marcescibilis TaxID=230819 RepID=A0A5C3KGF1_COPMA|nr:laccase 5 [Coprinopsis marcescibilis]
MQAFLTLAILSASLAPPFTQAQTSVSTTMGPVGTMIVANKVVGPDGHDRPVVVVNDVHPGPLITAKKGDTFQITVVNNLEDATMLRQTSVHWHGVFQHASAWADGPEGVTQCPIAQSGESFIYRFTCGQDAGTYWYHSHFGTQYCDGLRGPMVVYDPDDPHLALYDVDNENTVLTLADWYHTPAPWVVLPARAEATLINGKGRQPGNTNSTLEIVNVEPNRRYRFRLVSLSCDPNYLFSIDGHNLTVIEVDGQSVQPLHGVASIQTFAGQRYSFILNTHDKTIDNYWIRALPNVGAGSLPDGYEGGVNSAILRYVGAPDVEPNTSENNGYRLLEADLRSLLNPQAPGGSDPADLSINLALGFDLDSRKWTVDGATWVSPTEPVLVQMMNGVPPSEILPAGSIRVLPRNKVVEVSIPSLLVGGPHPFHLHGHAFSVIRSAGSALYNYENPIRRDVVSIGSDPTDNVTIRFVTDNPGPWFFHCHIEFHLHGGLAIVFAEATEDVPRVSAPPVEWNSLCTKYGSLSAEQTELTPPSV